MAEEEQGFAISRGSWLKNNSVARFDGTTIAWTGFEKIPEFEARDGDKFYRVVGNVRPEQIAKDFYGRPELWWVIAVANGIRVPLTEMFPGRTLRIPDPAEVLRQVQQREMIDG